MYDNERELDATTAQKVFGLPTQYVKKGEGRLLVEDYYLVQERASGKDLRPLPSYSADVTNAWMVVEKMMIDRWKCQLSFDPEMGGEWTASFANTEGLHEGTAAAPTFAVAVCLAALEAVEAQQKFKGSLATS